MKKYIKPIAKQVNLDNETLLAGSEIHDEKGNGTILSNQGTWDDFVLEDEEESSRW